MHQQFSMQLKLSEVMSEHTLAWPGHHFHFVRLPLTLNALSKERKKKQYLPLNPLWELSSGLRVRLCSAANMFQSKRRTESYGHGEWVKQVASVVVSLSSQFLFKSSGNHLNSFFEGLEIILTRAKANSILEYFTAHYSLEKGHSSPVDSP